MSIFLLHSEVSVEPSWATILDHCGRMHFRRDAVPENFSPTRSGTRLKETGVAPTQQCRSRGKGGQPDALIVVALFLSLL